ncbi:MAG TPA: serine hydrolase domain-containing protein, partial [Candidatus Baltobacteraceae bacterium]|nr:serine hydrolase domain-containing protein [Candidatus Baltobacteraceae bacterium]
MKISIRIAAALLLLMGSASTTYAASMVASADTPSKTVSGVMFTIPKGWSVRTHGPLVVMTSPESDFNIAIVDAGNAANANQAVRTAWQRYQPSAHRRLRLSTSTPARDGWDEQRNFAYETSPNEHRVVGASALRKGKRWTVAILDGSQATSDKRSAAIDLAGSSLRPAGYSKETFAGRTAHPLDAARINALTSFVQTGMRELDVPGVAIALVDHGKVVYEGGFGVRTLGDAAPVDANSLFMIASNTKGLSTLLLARLVDEGKLRWDEPVTEAYPSFRLGSEATTKKVRIEDLVCACTGLPRKDFDWIFNTTMQTPPSATFEQLATTEPTSKFGEVFQYNNLMASAAGYIAGHLVNPNMGLGEAYDSAMQSMIFNPLGMNETTFDMSRALGENHASPHGMDIEGHTALASPTFNYVVVPYRPAGGAWSSAHDLIKYVQNELDLGMLPNGSRFVSQENLLKRRAHNVPIGEDSYYGMGLMDDEHYGISVIHHGGDLIGFHSDIIAIPSAGVGALILTNSD